MKLKGQESAFARPESVYPNGLAKGFNGQKGMSKRYFTACMAMKLPQEYLEAELIDEDMMEDVKGIYIKSKNGLYYSVRKDMRKDCTTYSIKTSFEYRLVRQLYLIADEMLKQENQ